MFDISRQSHDNLKCLSIKDSFLEKQMLKGLLQRTAPDLLLTDSWIDDALRNNFGKKYFQTKRYLINKRFNFLYNCQDISNYCHLFQLSI